MPLAVKYAMFTALMLMGAIAFGCLSILCVGYTDVVAQATGDTRGLIATIGIWSGIMAFGCACAIPVAFIFEVFHTRRR